MSKTIEKIKVSDITILEEKLNELAKNIFILCKNFSSETGHGVIDINTTQGCGVKISIMCGVLTISAQVLPRI